MPDNRPARPRIPTPAGAETPDRRIMPRFGVLEHRAWTSWMDGEEFVAVEARLLDIGGGGACLECPREPPAGAEVWLCLMSDGRELDSVSGEVVGVGHGTRGRFRVRVAFWQPCNRRLFREAIGWAGSGIPDTEVDFDAVPHREASATRPSGA